MRRHLTVVVPLLLLLASVPARGDELRNVKVGEAVPPFIVPTLAGGELRTEALRGKVVVLVYLSAEQQSSEKAAQDAGALAREFRGQPLEIVFMTADATRVGFFRQQRDRLSLHQTLGLDVGRQVYGGLGLIVLPTTIVIDREGRLAHVIASRKSDHAHVLDVHVRHALGIIDDAELEKQLAVQEHQRDDPADRIARHRAAARLLRSRGLLGDAENELRAALKIDAADADAQLDLASLYIAQEKFSEAAAVVDQVTRAHPDHRRGKLIHGVVLFHTGRIDEAAGILEEVLLLNPDPVMTHYYLGLIAEQRGDEPAAIGHFKESLARLLEAHPM